MIVEPAAAVALKTGAKVAVPPEARLDIVQVMFPEVALTAGVVQDQPEGVAMETNDEPLGTESVNTTVEAVAGPLFVTTCVKVTLLPIVTGFGEPTSVTVRSAVVATFTRVDTLAELLESVGSVVPDVADTVSTI